MPRTKTDSQTLTVKGVRELAKLLAVSKTKAAELAKEPWFPAKGPDGSWSAAEIRRAIAKRDGDRDPAGGDAAEGFSEEDEQLLKVMRTSTDKLELARAAVPLAARRFGLAHGADVRTAGKTTQDLARALEELRRQEGDAVELGVRQGNLIERSAAVGAVVGTIHACTGLLQRFEVELAAKVEAWLADEKFRALTSEERARAVRSWTGMTSDRMRNEQADEVEAGHFCAKCFTPLMQSPAAETRITNEIRSRSAN